MFSIKFCYLRLHGDKEKKREKGLEREISKHLIFIVFPLFLNMLKCKFEIKSIKYLSFNLL